MLAEFTRISGGGRDTEGAGIAPKGSGEDVEDPSGSVCADGADLAAYLEVMLESSVLCAVWEVSSGFGGRHRGDCGKIQYKVVDACGRTFVLPFYAGR